MLFWLTFVEALVYSLWEPVLYCLLTGTDHTLYSGRAQNVFNDPNLLSAWQTQTLPIQEGTNRRVDAV